MITLRPAHERGVADFGWLDSRHTFSFGGYHDPRHMGFRNLRVINDDRVAPRGGFPTHGHRDMEIVSYVLEGALGHEDSMGHGSVIRPGDVQRMSAGTGVLHSEMNGSDTEPVHFLQIWLLPARRGIAPGYEQKRFDPSAPKVLVASPDGADGSVTIHSDARLWVLRSDGAVPIGPGRGAWVHVARGRFDVLGQALGEGDGAAIEGEPEVVLRGAGEALVFDLG